MEEQLEGAQQQQEHIEVISQAGLSLPEAVKTQKVSLFTDTGVHCTWKHIVSKIKSC